MPTKLADTARILAAIMLRFGPQIAIRVSPEVFFLTKEDASLSLPTYLYIDSTAANPRVVAVGEEISGVPADRVFSRSFG